MEPAPPMPAAEGPTLIAPAGAGASLDMTEARVVGRGEGRPLPPIELALVVLASLGLIGFGIAGWLALAEVVGFVSGVACVWLIVRQHIANWPLGLLNNAVLFGLFLHVRLYADMSLQVLFFALGVYGWVTWLRGGGPGKPLPVTRITRLELTGVILFLPLATLAMLEVLTALNGAAPFCDALVTALSLAAQYLTCRKRLESWFVWIAVDLVSVPLFITRGLPLTAVLYGVFLLLCIGGLASWSRAK